MKLVRRAVIALVVIAFCGSALFAQDLAKYRNFSFGMSAATVSKLVEQRPADVIVIHEQPALIQELTWYPPPPFQSGRPAEPVQKVLFSFYNGELYRMLVAYDSDAIKGLTNEDMMRVLSEKYGSASTPVAEVHFPMADSYRATEKVIARWEDTQYSVNLFRSSIPDTFAVVMFTKRMDAQAATSIAESVKLEHEEAPRMEAARVRQAAIDLEVQRQKNIKVLRP